ncbi:MAG: Histone deacetylase hda1 [Claussenomyces sp. TS43310]|nr:MAG: Histone deacetylase hda1 [Claussenomyces sp. TS43310]
MENVNDDIIMQSNLVVNNHEESNFVDPRMLDQVKELEVVDVKSARSSESGDLHPVKAVLARKTWAPTGCCYDDRMKLHANADYSSSPAHPEDPRRIESIMKEFKDADLIFQGTDSELEEILKQCPIRYMWRISARPATKPEICTVHFAHHFHWVQGLSEKTSAELRILSETLDYGRKSLYVGNLTFEAALISAGGAIETCKHVVAGNVKNAIAVIRPPGHHAEAKEAMGFCIFNNVPIAARVCQIEYPETCRKILILDWDVHHGNGTQNIFYEDPNVLYISLHVYQEGQFYPGEPEDPNIPDGGPANCGLGLGLGKNINIGWHDQGMGDGEYMTAFQRIVMPIAQEFDPDLVIVSAGFDAAEGDELGGCFVTPACYAHMTHMLMSLAGGKVAVCLEGGYNLRAISRSALAVAKTLMGEPPPRLTIPPINREAELVIQQVKEYQAPYWQCMRSGQILPRDLQVPGTARLNDVIRAYQRKILFTHHKMITLYVQRDRLYKSFEDQVLVTPGISAAGRILFIIHDPPELLAHPDPVSNRIESHNAWLTDGVMPYIDRAIANGFGILDINMPMHLTSVENGRHGFAERPTEAELQNQTKELVCYLWDNYLEVCETYDIVLMGVGDSYLGIKMLLTSRDCKFKFRSVVNFVSGNLRPIKSETDSELSSWYKHHSQVFVASDHACWDNEEYVRKIKKSRFGTVIRSKEAGLNRMMAAHFDEAFSFILKSVGGGDTASR